MPLSAALKQAGGLPRWGRRRLGIGGSGTRVRCPHRLTTGVGPSGRCVPNLAMHALSSARSASFARTRNESSQATIRRSWQSTTAARRPQPSAPQPMRVPSRAHRWLLCFSRLRFAWTQGGAGPCCRLQPRQVPAHVGRGSLSVGMDIMSHPAKSLDRMRMKSVSKVVHRKSALRASRPSSVNG